MESTRAAESMTVEDLESEMCTLSSRIAAAESRLMALIAEYDAREAWARWECRSCAHWLEWKCALSANAARERVRVAKALVALPAISGEFSRGRLSYSQVRALTRAATPQNEAELLRVAKHMTAAQLEDAIRTARGAASANESEIRRESRFLIWHYDDDGCLVITIKVPPEEGAAVIARIKEVASAIEAESVSAETPQAEREARTLPQLRSDALVLIAKSAPLGNPRSITGGNGRHVVIHADASVLSRGEGSAYVEAGPSVSAETVKRLTCDAVVTAVYERSPGDVISVGRSSRRPTEKQRRALWIRDRHCRFPGCTNSRFVDAHHIWHWSEGGPTDLSNLVLICSYHHASVHERGTTLHRDAKGSISARTKAGFLLGPAESLPGTGRAGDIDFGADYSESLWEGTSRRRAREAVMAAV